jgi:hypothetical protein
MFGLGAGGGGIYPDPRSRSVHVRDVAGGEPVNMTLGFERDPIGDGAATPPAQGRSRGAVVVFVDRVETPWLRVLPRGFRHVFAVIEEGSSWLLCDPRKDRIELRLLELPPGFDLAAHYRAQGHHVLVGRVALPRPRRRLALCPLTCVAVVKRLLGVHAPRVQTPRQLYRHLRARPEPFAAPHAAHPAPPRRHHPRLPEGSPSGQARSRRKLSSGRAAELPQWPSPVQQVRGGAAHACMRHGRRGVV